MPSLHILSTEEKETIQRKLQNGYFMFRERSVNPPRWCYSTVEKQNRNELKSQPSSFGSLQRTSRNPPAAVHLGGSSMDIVPLLLREDGLLEVHKNRKPQLTRGPQKLLLPQDVPLGCTEKLRRCTISQRNKCEWPGVCMYLLVKHSTCLGVVSF